MSGFTSFLKKMGQVLNAGLTFTSVVFPVLRPLLGSAAGTGSNSTLGRIDTGVNDFTAIGTVILQIEAALVGKTGPEKLVAASTLVSSIIKTSELVSGHKIAQEAEFIAGVKDLTNAVVRIMNSLDSNNIHTDGSPDPASAPLAAPTPV